MDFDFSFEQRLLAESVGKTLAAFPPVLDRGAAPYAPADVLRALAELGVFGNGAAEEPPLGCADAVAVAIEVGRHLVAAPVVETLAAAIALAPGRADLAAALANGDIVGVAVSGCVSPDGGQVLLPFAGGVGIVLAPMAAAGRRDWIQLAAKDVSSVAAGTSDPTTGAVWARVEPQTAAPAPNAPALFAMDDVLPLLAMAEIVGTADACLAQTLSYIRERKQFGRPVGSNQAIKHMAADAAAAIEVMKAAVEFAGWSLDRAAADEAMREEADLALLAARSFVGEHGRQVAERCVQMHGGIAFTWDYGLHRHLGRIGYRTNTLVRTMEGREALAARLLDDRATQARTTA